MQSVENALYARDVFVHYTTSRGLYHAVHQATFTLERGKCLALVGESGSGKTTLAKAICGLLPISKGSIHIAQLTDKPYHSRMWHKHVQLIFQDPDSIFNPKRTIGWHCNEILSIWSPHLSDIEKDHKIGTLLEQMELSKSVLTRHSFELSGGQKQRASLVRSLLVEPQFLVLDEPLASQDASKRKNLLLLLKTLQERYRLGYLYITHDLSRLSLLADEVAVMLSGHIVERKQTDELLKSPEHPYTQRLLQARLSSIQDELRKRALAKR